ncbi:hypothetical protein HK098_006275 [Nowakowskiella sp. JEL0407]|nr:hypothetical protein HK098_006275 [Nowakowskiella sp. JEL0407]
MSPSLTNPDHNQKKSKSNLSAKGKQRAQTPKASTKDPTPHRQKKQGKPNHVLLSRESSHDEECDTIHRQSSRNRKTDKLVTAIESLQPSDDDEPDNFDSDYIKSTKNFTPSLLSFRRSSSSNTTGNKRSNRKIQHLVDEDWDVLQNVASQSNATSNSTNSLSSSLRSVQKSSKPSDLEHLFDDDDNVEPLPTEEDEGSGDKQESNGNDEQESHGESNGDALASMHCPTEAELVKTDFAKQIKKIIKHVLASEMMTRGLIFSESDVEESLIKECIENCSEKINDTRKEERYKRYSDSALRIILDSREISKLPRQIRSEWKQKAFETLRAKWGNLISGIPVQRSPNRWNEKWLNENPTLPFGSQKKTSELVQALWSKIDGINGVRRFAHRDINIATGMIDTDENDEVSKEGLFQSPFIYAVVERFFKTGYLRIDLDEPTPEIIAGVYMIVFSIFGGIDFGFGLAAYYSNLIVKLTKAMNNGHPMWDCICNTFSPILQARPRKKQSVVHPTSIDICDLKQRAHNAVDDF